MSEFAVFGGAGGHGAQPGNVGPNTYETITIRFVDEADNLTTVQDGKISLQRDSTVITDAQAINNPVPNEPGWFQLQYVTGTQYTFTFSTSCLEPGLYDFVAMGTIPSGRTAKMIGQFTIQNVSRTKMFIERLRKHLFDIDPKLYLLDEPRLIFPDDLLLEYLNTAMSEINSTPPSRTALTLETSNSQGDIDALIIKGAVVYALRSRAVLEAFNKLSYSDSQALNIDRMPQLSQLAENMNKDWLEAIKRWKVWYAIYGSGTSAVGMGTTTIPIQVSRALSLLPNLSQTFSI
jgi:hypothetical protein